MGPVATRRLCVGWMVVQEVMLEGGRQRAHRLARAGRGRVAAR